MIIKAAFFIRIGSATMSIDIFGGNCVSSDTMVFIT